MAVALTSTSPSVGGEGDNIRLNGSGLSGVTSVKFGGTEAASFTIVNSGRIQAVMPAQTASCSMGLLVAGGPPATFRVG